MARTWGGVMWPHETQAARNAGRYANLVDEGDERQPRFQNSQLEIGVVRRANFRHCSFLGHNCSDPHEHSFAVIARTTVSYQESRVRLADPVDSCEEMVGKEPQPAV